LPRRRPQKAPTGVLGSPSSDNDAEVRALKLGRDLIIPSSSAEHPHDFPLDSRGENTDGGRSAA
jgi:hypothetical protein